MGALDRFATNFTGKTTLLNSFLVNFKLGPTVKERFFFPGRKFFPLRVDPFWEKEQKHFWHSCFLYKCSHSTYNEIKIYEHIATEHLKKIQISKWWAGQKICNLHLNRHLAVSQFCLACKWEHYCQCGILWTKGCDNIFRFFVCVFFFTSELQTVCPKQ